MKPVSEKLANKAEVIYIPIATKEVATILVTFRVGTRSESSLQKGIAHFIEHLFFKGCRKFPSTLALSSFIESKGGEFNAFTDREFTAFYVKIPKEHLGAGLEFLSEMLKVPLFAEKEIETEKGVIIEEINMYEDTPTQKVADLIEHLFFGDSSLGWPIVGTKESILSLGKRDFEKFYKEHYLGSNMVIALSGGIDLNNSRNLVKKYFADFPKKKPQSLTKAIFQKELRELHQKKSTEQTHLILGFRGVPFSSPEREPAKVLATLLGGGMSSRLFIEIRERQGLCYYIYAKSHHNSDFGEFLIHAGIDSQRRMKAISAILQEIKKIKEGDITLKELERAKEIVKGRLLIRMEDSGELASFYTQQLVYHRPLKLPEEILEEINRVSLEDVIKLSKRIFTYENFYLASIGPKDFKLPMEGRLI